MIFKCSKRNISDSDRNRNEQRSRFSEKCGRNTENAQNMKYL